MFYNKQYPFFCWLGWAKIHDLYIMCLKLWFTWSSLGIWCHDSIAIQKPHSLSMIYKLFSCIDNDSLVHINQCYLKDYGAISAIPLNEYYSLILDLSLQHGIYVPNIDNFGYRKSSKL